MKNLTTALLIFSLNSFGQDTKPCRVYVDMVADLFHYGHVKFLKKAKRLGGPNAQLIVGICSDEDVTDYKRKPILSMKERIKSVKGCKYVDEVLGDAPIRVDKEWIEKYKIDLVVHGDDFSEKKIREYYSVPLEMGIFKTVPYTITISTTEIIKRVQSTLP